MKIKKIIHKLAWGIVIGIILLSFARLVIPRCLEPAIAGLIHTRLSSWLGVPASVCAVDVDWPRGKIGLYGLRVAQPNGFGKGELLYVSELEAVIRLRALLSGTLDLLEMRMAHFQLDLYTDVNGQNGFAYIMDTIRSRQARDGEALKSRDGFLDTITLHSLAATDGRATFREDTATNQTFELIVRDINIDARNLHWTEHKSRETNQTGRILMTGRLHQRPFRDGRGGVILQTRPLGGDDPSLDCNMRFVGIELAAIAPFLPRSTAAILGGDALDLSVDMRLDAGALNGQATIETIAGYQYAAALSGTPQEPTVTTDSDAVAYVLSRTHGGISKIFRNLDWAGKGAAGAIAETVTDLADGAVKTVGSFGQGLLQTAKGVVTFDGSDIGLGTKAMGTAITGGATDAIVEAGGGIMEGVGSISYGLTGDEAAEQWRRQIPVRWEKSWQEAVSNTVHESRIPTP